MKFTPLLIFIAFQQLVFAQCSFTVTVNYNNPTCYGFSDGSISISIQGANGTSTVEITDSLGNIVSPFSTANSLTEGWYYFSVTDDTPCTEIDSVYLDAPGPIEIDLTTSDLSCFGDNSGSVVVDTVYNYNGDFSNIGYFWNPSGSEGNGIGQSSQTGLNSGNYDLTINDENGCSGTFNFTLSSPPELVLTDLGTDPCSDSAGGCVWAVASGGVPSYDYTWTNLQSNQSVSQTTWCDLEFGCYEILIIDDSGCELKDTVCISCLTLDEEVLLLDVYPNPTDGILYFESNLNEIKSITVFNLNGSVVDIFKEEQSSIDLSDLSSGSYLIVIETASALYRRKFFKN